MRENPDRELDPKALYAAIAALDRWNFLPTDLPNLRTTIASKVVSAYLSALPKPRKEPHHETPRQHL